MFKRVIATLSAIVLVAGTLAGCLTNPTKQDIGTVLGAVAGGVIGKQLGGNTFSTIAGTLAGAWAGSAIGKSMDERDKENAAKVLGNALSSSVYSSDNNGKPIAQSTWVRDGRVFKSEVHTEPLSRPDCKAYSQRLLVVIDGKSEVATKEGYACKNPRTNEWEIDPN